MPEMVENRMVVDWQWPDVPEEVKKKLNGTGWRQIETDVFVPDENAFDYAIERCSRIPFAVVGIEWEPDFIEMVVEWFYSGGNWVHEDGAKTHTWQP